jgi:hypothetical protein
VIIFGSVRFLSKKVTKPKLFFFEKKTETEPKPGQTGLARFFPVLARFFKVWLGFFGLARFSQFGSVFFRFFVGFGSVRFGFLFIKPNRTGWFFKKFNRFFFSFGFFSYFFSVFSV